MIKTHVRKQVNVKEASEPASVSIIRQVHPERKLHRHEKALLEKAKLPERKRELPESKYLFIKEKFVFKKVEIKDIYLIKGLSDYICLSTPEKCYTLHSTMYGILEKLPQEDYIRVHKSFIVRLHDITSFDHNFVTVHDKLVPIGKLYREELMTRLQVL